MFKALQPFYFFFLVLSLLLFCGFTKSNRIIKSLFVYVVCVCYVFCFFCPVVSPTRTKRNRQLVRFLRLAFLGGEDAFLLEGIFRAEVWEFMNEPVSRTNEAAVNEFLATRCALMFFSSFFFRLICLVLLRTSGNSVVGRPSVCGAGFIAWEKKQTNIYCKPLSNTNLLSAAAKSTFLFVQTFFLVDRSGR